MSLKNELKDLKQEIKQWSTLEKVLTILLIVVLCAGAAFLGWGIYDMEKNPEKYEQAARERAIAEQVYNEKHTYEIISVEEYIRVTTNQFGAVTDQSPAYSIWYKNPSKPGGVDLIEDIEFHPYGIHKMVISEDIDAIIFRMDGGITIKLTEETMRGM